MRIGGLEFRPPWLLSAFTAVVLPLCIIAGLWQLDRAAQRKEIVSSLEKKKDQAPVALDALVLDADSIRYSQVSVRGNYEPEHEFLVDNSVNESSDAGYNVVTPLRISGTQIRILVNRGWVPLGASRDVLPNIETPVDEISISGMADLAIKPSFTLGGDKEIKQDWPRLWAYLDLNRFAEAVSYPVQPIIILQDQDGPYGFDRKRAKKTFFKTKYYINMGYAIQWFGFATIIVVYFFIKSIRKLRVTQSVMDSTESM